MGEIGLETIWVLLPTAQRISGEGIDDTLKERVAEKEMLSFIGSITHDEVIRELDPLKGQATVEKFAINAVMAGCRPQYLPIIIAAVEALVEPEFNLRGVQTTDENVAPLLLINGPELYPLRVSDSRGDIRCVWQRMRISVPGNRYIRSLAMKNRQVLSPLCVPRPP